MERKLVTTVFADLVGSTALADEALLERAVERFEAMSLDWHAEETRRLVAKS